MYRALQNTLVATTWLVVATLLAGFIIFFLLKTKPNFLVSTVLGTCSVLVNIPLVINGLFASGTSVQLKQPIIGKHYAQGESNSFVVINYDGLVKNIDVYNKAQIDSASYVVLTVNKGLLGYYVIKHTRLVKN